MRSYTQIIALLLTITLCPFVAADKLYKWVDAKGKVHYSDKPPVDTHKVTDITDDLKPVNTSRTNDETARLKQVFPQESEAERAYRQQTQQQEARQKHQRDRACARARADLRKMQGRVIFVDKNGKRYTISETERARRAEELKKLVDKRC